MNRLKLLAAAMLLAVPIISACGDELPPPPPTGSIDGLVSIEGQGIDAVSVTLSNGASATTANGGMFRFDGVEAGAYTVTISNYPADASFDQTSAAATIATDGETVTINFPGTFIRTSSIMGTVTVENEGLSGVTVKLSGTGESETLTDGNGQYAFAGLRAGNYTIEISGFDDEDVSFGSSSSAATVAVGESKVVSFEGTYLRTSGILGQVTADDQPQELVTVSLQGRGENRSMTTNSAGQYSFDELRSGDYAIGISGYSTDEMSFDVTSKTVTVAYGETATLPFEGTLLRTAGIMGTVTVEGVGPISDVTVTIQGNGETHEDETNNAGMYSFNRLHAGDYSVTISGFDDDEYGFDATTATVTVALQETETVEFDGIMLRTAGISGEVTVGDDDTPLPGVTVTVSGGPRDEEHSATTDSDGTYLVENLHAGDYSVVISGYDTREYGFDPTTETVSVGLRETLEVAFQGTLLRTAGVSGRVSVGGMGIPGVTVTLTGEEDRDPENTNADGQFGFTGLAAGDYTLTISEYDAVEYAFEPTREFELELDGAEIENFTGRALRTAGVSGRVSVGGMGIPGVTVTLTGEEDRDPENTNADGQFGFTGLAAGDYTLTISEYDAVEYAFEPTREFELELDGAEIENFTGRALRTATVMGYVTVEGAPLPGIDVTLIKGVGTSGEIVGAKATGETGGYTFGPLLAGDYQVRIGEYADEYDFAAGDMQVTAVMTDSTATVNFAATIIRTASVSGRVTIAGDPMKDVTVTLTGDHAPDDNSRMTGDYGMYEFDDLRKGDYTLTISGYDAVDYHFEPTGESFALELGGSEIKNFTGKALRTATVMGEVTVEDAPLPGIGVTLIKVVSATSGEIVGTKATGDNGGYTFGPLLAGAYQVRIGEYDDEYDFAAGDMQVTAVMTDSTATVNFAATIIRTASVSGMVTIDGEAMKDVTVTISGEHAPADSSMMTGDDGSYSFDELRKGAYTVTMTNPDDNAYSFPTVATPVNLGVGQEQPGISFAGTRLKRASISGQVHAAGDPVKDVTVTLSGDADGEDVDGEDMTDDNGEYNFPGLAIGSYTVTISGWAEAAYIFNAPASDTEIVNNDDFLIVDFEGEHTKTASISGMLFIDEGGQTALAHDAGEPVLDLDAVLPEDMPGLPITLLGPELTSPPTDGFASREGMYSFGNLQAGTYVVNVDVETKIETDPMTNDSATVEDLLAGLGYEYTGPSLILVSVAAAEEKTDVNLPFKITLQTINVGAVMGTPDTATATLVGGVKLALYPTAEAADAGTPILGTATTGADPEKPNHGVAKFEFPRAMDLGPGGTGNDRLVFAKVTSTGHGDLEFSDNRHIEIQYAATDRVSNALTAARLVNVQVNFQWSVKSNETAKDGDDFLGGWAANNGEEPDDDGFMAYNDTTDEITGLAKFSDRLEVPDAIAGKTYTVMLAEAQVDSVTGKERWIQSDAKWHTHDPLLLPDAERLNDLDPIYVTWTTQSLTLGVYREADDVEGYTDYRSALPSGDVRPHPEVGRGMTVELMTRDDDDRLRLYDAWDHDCDDDGEKEMPTKARDAKGDFRAGMITFRCLDVDKEFTVRFRAGDDREQMDYGYDEIETFGDDLDFGVTLGAFGAMGGAGPEVRMCSASDGTNAEATSDEWCATFAYQWETGTVYGTVGDESGHEVVVEPETGHGAIGDEDETGRGGAYSIGDLQDGVYTAKAASGDDDYQILESTPAEVEGIALYHNEACWAATNPEPATGDEQPGSCAADEVEVGEDDDGDTTYTYVNGHEENWRTGRLGLAIRGYVANDGQDGEDRDNLLRGDESMAGITMTLRRGTVVVRTAKTEASGFYSFDELAEGSYTVSAGRASNALAIHAINRHPRTRAWRTVTSKTARAEDYTLNPDEADLNKPYWIRSFSTSGRTMGNGTVTYAPGTGTPPSDTYYNFALVYTDGQLTGSVDNISGSSADIDLVFGSPVPSEDDRERTTNNRGNFEISGLMEAIGYTAVIEDAGFAVPCMNAAGTIADDDHVDNDGECRNPAATVLEADVLGEDDHQSMGTLYVYSTAASANEVLGTVTILGRSTDEGDGFDTTTTWNAGWTRVDAEETENTSSIGTTTYKSRTVTVSFGSSNAAIPDSATYSIEANGDDCTGTRCELDADKTDDETGEAAAGPMENTITVTVTAENGYDDHVYSTVVSVAAPVGATLAAANIDATDSEGNDLTVDGGTDGALTLANAMTLATAEGETRVNVVFGLTVLGDPEESNAYCAQVVAVTPLNGNALTAEDDDDDDVCEGTRYTLTVPTGGQVYEIDVTSEDDVTVTRHLRVTRGGGTDANQAPEVTAAIADLAIEVGASKAVDVSSNFSDPDDDALTFTAVSNDVALATVVVSGSVLTITGVADGTATITVKASDGTLSAEDKFFVAVGTPPNAAPEVTEPIDDQQIDLVGGTIPLDVAGNFTDPNGDELTFTAVSSATGTATVEVSGSELTITGVADGTATITVTASDGTLSAEDKFVVTVGTPPNAAPEVTMEIDDQQIDSVGGNIFLDVSGNFSDPDGDDLSFTAVSSATGAATVVVSESTLLITGVADGTDTITVTASDGTLSAEDKFVVTVGNLPPEVTTEIPDQHIQTAGKTILLDVAGNFTDPDGDTLSFAAMSDATGTATVSVINGSVLVITGVADGTATITVTATDPDGANVTDAFEVTVGNRDPEVSEEIEDQHIATAPGFMSLDVSGNFSDPDGDDPQLHGHERTRGHGHGLGQRVDPHDHRCSGWHDHNHGHGHRHR